VAFPDDILTTDERIVLRLHPHWKALVGPILILAVAVVVLVAAFVLPDEGSSRLGFAVIAVAVGVVALWKAIWPLLTWRSTHYIFTDERVLLQSGVLARDRRDIPLSRINDYAMTQRFIERLLGCGTFTIESAGERGQAVLANVPGVGRVQTTLYELVEADRDRHAVGDDESVDREPDSGLRELPPA